MRLFLLLYFYGVLRTVLSWRVINVNTFDVWCNAIAITPADDVNTRNRKDGVLYQDAEPVYSIPKNDGVAENWE